MPLSGVAIAEIGVGGVLVYSGIKGATIANTFQSLLKGTTPTASETINTQSAGSDASISAPSPAPAVSGNYTTAELEALWEAEGGDAATAAYAAAVAIAESSGSPTVTSSNPDGGTNVGLWQLDTEGVGAGYTVAELQNPETNAKITVLATHNGTDWSEWSDPVVNSEAPP